MEKHGLISDTWNFSLCQCLSRLMFNRYWGLHPQW